MLKAILIFILFIHALIHFIGFAKAYHYGNITQLATDISKPVGLVWLTTGFLFLVAVLLLLVRKESWPYVAIVAVIISQILIVTVWHDAWLGTILNVVVLFVAITSLASHRFEIKFKADVERHRCVQVISATFSFCKNTAFGV